jgi:hypothetical protein
MTQQSITPGGSVRLGAGRSVVGNGIPTNKRRWRAPPRRTAALGVNKPSLAAVITQAATNGR